VLQLPSPPHQPVRLAIKQQASRLFCYPLNMNLSQMKIDENVTKNIKKKTLKRKKK
jgi:hypothetical protein